MSRWTRGRPEPTRTGRRIEARRKTNKRHNYPHFYRSDIDPDRGRPDGGGAYPRRTLTDPSDLGAGCASRPRPTRSGGRPAGRVGPDIGRQSPDGPFGPLAPAPVECRRPAERRRSPLQARAPLEPAESAVDRPLAQVETPVIVGTGGPVRTGSRSAGASSRPLAGPAFHDAPVRDLAGSARGDA